MFRLIIALGVAVVLLPAETITENHQVVTTEVTSYDAFSAAQSLYSDVSSFCDRNEETCITGKALAENAVKQIRGGLQKFAQKNSEEQSNVEIDPVKTSAVTK